MAGLTLQGAISSAYLKDISLKCNLTEYTTGWPGASIGKRNGGAVQKF
jgi:hypothetical protein